MRRQATERLHVTVAGATMALLLAAGPPRSALPPAALAARQQGRWSAVRSAPVVGGAAGATGGAVLDEGVDEKVDETTGEPSGSATD
jgi:hypothetical protein